MNRRRSGTSWITCSTCLCSVCVVRAICRRYYQGQGLKVLHGFTYKYLTLEHFLGELTQLQVGYPLADALAYRYS